MKHNPGRKRLRQLAKWARRKKGNYTKRQTRGRKVHHDAKSHRGNGGE